MIGPPSARPVFAETSSAAPVEGETRQRGGRSFGVREPVPALPRGDLSPARNRRAETGPAFSATRRRQVACVKRRQVAHSKIAARGGAGDQDSRQRQQHHHARSAVILERPGSHGDEGFRRLCPESNGWPGMRQGRGRWRSS